MAKLNTNNKVPGVYIGETARSLYERGREHWRGFRERREDSHIWKHQVLHHGGDNSPKFHLRPLEFHRTALNRQISEAVKIGRFGEENLLNSKGEYNRSRIARLSLGEMNIEKKPELEEDYEAVNKKMEEWTGQKSIEISRKSQSEWRKKNPLRKMTSGRRKEDDTRNVEDTTNTSRKRRKFDLIGEGCWGEESSRLVTTCGIPQPYLPLQRRVVGRRRGHCGSKSEKNYSFASNDIRRFFASRAVTHTREQKYNEEDQNSLIAKSVYFVNHKNWASRKRRDIFYEKFLKISEI